MESKQIPGYLLRKWEIAATRQHLSQSEFTIYIRERQKEYFDSLRKSGNKKVMVDGQLTDYGKKVALEYYHNMNSIQRAITLSKVDFMVLNDQIEKRGYTERICLDIISSFELLRERMDKYNLSNEDVLKYRLNFESVRKMYFDAKKTMAAIK